MPTKVSALSLLDPKAHFFARSIRFSLPTQVLNARTALDGDGATDGSNCIAAEETYDDMCGIGVALWSSPSPTARTERPAGSPKAAGIPKAVLRRRGPDAQAEVVVGELHTTGFELHLTAAVLHMRGDACRPQPLRSDAGDVLLWNGEIFGGVAVGVGESDTERLLSALVQAAGAGGDDDAVPQLLASLRGPWALAFWHAASHTLWYGRDGFGRRSLLRATAEDEGCEALLLCSVAAPLPPLLAPLQLDAPGHPDHLDEAKRMPAWHELPANGLGRVRVALGGGLAHAWLPRAAALPPPPLPLPPCLRAPPPPPTADEPLSTEACEAA